MKVTETQKHLEEIGACKEAREWIGERALADAWNDCERGDWLAWYVGRVAGPVDSPSRRKLVGALADCAALALPVYEARFPNDSRVRDCIEACRKYAAGLIGRDELRRAGIAADTAAAAAGAFVAYAAGAFVAAGSAADAAVADTAAYADYAVYAYAAYAAYADTAAARDQTLHQCADIIRQHYPTPPEPIK